MDVQTKLIREVKDLRDTRVHMATAEVTDDSPLTISFGGDPVAAQAVDGLAPSLNDVVLVLIQGKQMIVVAKLS